MTAAPVTSSRGSGPTRDHATRELVERSTKAQNLPLRVDDAAALHSVAVLITRPPLQGSFDRRGLTAGASDRSTRAALTGPEMTLDSATRSVSTSERVADGGKRDAQTVTASSNKV